MSKTYSLKIPAIIFGIIAFLSFLFITYKDDKMRLNLMFEPADNYQEFVAEEYRTSWSIIEGAKEGDALIARLYSYKPGEYSIDFSCNVSEEGSTVSIYTDGHVLSDNSFITSIVDTVPLSPEKSRYHIDYTIPSLCREVRLVVNYSGVGNLKISRVYNVSDGLYYNDAAFVICVAFVMFVIWMFVRNKGIKEEILWAIVVGLIASIPVMGRAFYEGADLSFHLMRLQGLAQGLGAGEFPVRIQSVWRNGIGYPVSVFYPDILLYPAAILIVLGVSEYYALVAIIIFWNIITAFVSKRAYTSMTESNVKGMVASAFYTLATFRILIAFHGCGIGNLIALTYIPIVFWGIYEVLWRDYTRWILLVVGMTGVLSSHLLTTIIASSLCFVCCLIGIVRLKEKGRLLSLAKAVIVTCLVNLWFVVPFLDMYDKNFTLVYEGSRINETCVYLSQMFQWIDIGGNSTLLSSDTAGERSMSVGFVCALFLLVSFIVGINKKEKGFVYKISFLITLIFLWISSEFFPWEYVYRIPMLGKFMYHLQYAWRFYTISAVALPLVIVSVFDDFDIEKKMPKRNVVLLALLLAIINIAPIMDAFVQNFEPFFEDKYRYAYAFIEDTENRDYLYRDVSDSDLKAMPRNIIADGATVSDYYRKGSSLQFSYSKNDGTDSNSFVLPVINYPHYEATLNGKAISISESSLHRMKIDVSGNYPKEGIVRVKFREPFYWRICELVSVISIMGLVVLVRRRRL
nr:hypothetical protein [uncultured Butyrivibrio sp.]